jgi:hypothetical protein
MLFRPGDRTLILMLRCMDVSCAGTGRPSRPWRRGSGGPRVRRADDEQVAHARRDLAVGLALAASWFSVWGLYATYTWTANPFGSTLQFARFYLPAAGPIALLGSWLVTRLPRLASLAALISATVAVAMFGLGAWSFAVMRESPFGGIHQGPPGAVPQTAQGRQPGTVPQALTRQAGVSESWVRALKRARGAQSPNSTRREP